MTEGRAGNLGEGGGGVRRRGLRIAVLCLGLCAVAASFWMVHSWETRRANAHQSAGAAYLALADAVMAARDYRRAVEGYLLAPTREPLAPVGEAERGLQRRLNSLAGHGATAPDMVSAVLSELDRVRNRLRSLETIQTRIGADLSSGLLGDMRRAGDAVATALEAQASQPKPPSGLSTLREAFHKARKIETVFLVREGRGDPQNEAGELDALVGLVRAARFPARTEARLSKLVSDYRDAFAGYVEAVLARGASERELRAGLDTLIERLTSALAARPAEPEDDLPGLSGALATRVQLAMPLGLLAAGLALVVIGAGGFTRTHAEAATAKAPDVEGAPRPEADGPEVTGEGSPSQSEIIQDAREAAVRAEALAEVRKAGEAWKARNARIGDMAQHLEETVSIAIASLKTAAGAMNEAVGAVAVTARNVLGAADRSGANHRAVLAALAAAQDQQAALSGSLEAVNELARSSCEAANDARGRSGGADAVMDRLSTSTQRIEGMLEAIRAVAERTNLLALNATIEAARAGAAGKGFAVVAQEVKQLAAQTVTATQDIEAEVQAIRSASDDAIEAFRAASGAIGTVDEVADGVRQTVSAQRTEIAVLSLRLEEAAALGEDGDKAVAAISKARGQAEETGAAVDRLAQIMLEEAARVDDEMKSFLTTLRAL
ncbi:methyl-accepting chemotaxis protein [Breoghania sp.]|uniref:methyl-accepting chemotaxis protein n=1 Tax=Breoghania sp. TaxID=2065378 RepID=UPI0029CA9C8E|nr:methyl-accepting chemotaxis protein [Breoghania sp.]